MTMGGDGAVTLPQLRALHRKYPDLALLHIDAHTDTYPTEGYNTAATFTPYGLFIRADFVVKGVLILLVLASFWSWVLIIDKSLAFFSLKRKAREFERNFWSGRSLEDLYAQHSHRADQPFTAVFVAALQGVITQILHKRLHVAPAKTKAFVANVCKMLIKGTR